MAISVFYLPGPFLINSPHVLGLAAAVVEFECGLGRSVRSLAVRSQSTVRSQSAESAEKRSISHGRGSDRAEPWKDACRADPSPSDRGGLPGPPPPPPRPHCERCSGSEG